VVERTRPLAYHVTQRGAGGIDVFYSHGDRRVYEDLAAGQLTPAGVSVYAYCWMTVCVRATTGVAGAPGEAIDSGRPRPLA
jgi:hypothetical protein